MGDVDEVAERVLCCWEDGPRTTDSPGGGSTCLLPHGHEGTHEFTPDSEITVRFT